MDARQRRRIQRRATDQEAAAAVRFGGRRNPGSGNGPVHKNDVRTPDLLIEAKTSANRKQITLRLEDFTDVERNAALVGKLGVMHMQIGERKLIVLDESDFEMLYRKARDAGQEGH